MADRNALLTKLDDLAPAQLQQVIDRVSGASRYDRPNLSVPERVSSLVQYAESSVGPGLDAIATVVDKLFAKPAPATVASTATENTTTTPKDSSAAPKIFISYSHKDKKWLDELLIQLKPIIRNAQIDPWVDTAIQAGAEWDTAIQEGLQTADAGVLLVTPNFLASDYIFHKELPELLKKKILWIAVSPSAYRETEIAKYQALNDPSKPLAGMKKADRDAAWVAICQKIKAALNNP